MKKLTLAIIGQGRSGKDIHGKFYKSEANDRFTVRYVVEADEGRRARALSDYPGCETLADYRELFGKERVDLVVNAACSCDHFPITLDLLSHGYNVLVEKPFARNVYECDTLIRTAKEQGVTLAVFQQTFYAPYYKHILETANSGKLGEILEVDVRFSGFCRRWDWQTLQKKMGGNAYNTGPHPIGVALGLLGFDPHTRVAFSRLFRTPLSSGDADNYAKIILTTPKGTVADIGISSSDAYSDYTVKLQGAKGTLRATTGKYECKYLVDGENPPRPLVEGTLVDENGNPCFCKEKLVLREERGTYDGGPIDVGTRELYYDLYDAITTGKTMFVTPEMARKVIEVIETAHTENPLPLTC